MKKLLVLTITLLSTLSAFALEGFLRPLPVVVGYSQVQPDNYYTESLCPKYDNTDEKINCIVDGTILVLEYSLPCHYEIVSHNYLKLHNDEQNKDVVVSTLAKYKSQVGGVKCLGISNVVKKITFINYFGAINLHNMRDLPRSAPTNNNNTEIGLPVVKPLEM